VLAVVLGQGADRLGDDRVEDGQLLVDDPLPVGGEVNEDLAPVGGVGAPFDQPAALEGVEQRYGSCSRCSTRRSTTPGWQSMT